MTLNWRGRFIFQIHKSINTRYLEITPQAQTDVMTRHARLWPSTNRAPLVHKTCSPLLTMDLQF